MSEEGPKEATLYGARPEENSLLFWFPKIKDLGIPVPETVWYKISKNTWDLSPVCDGDFSPLKDDWDGILAAANKIGFPLFMRTDEFSGKHDWEHTCYVKDVESLRSNIQQLVEGSLIADMMGLPIRAFVFRKYIPMRKLFECFGHGMPVNREYRVFIKNGRVQCIHWYWFKQALRDGASYSNLPENWEAIVDKESELPRNEYNAFVILATEVAQVLPGYWSVDFCQGADGTWYLIDMAQGHVSWHPDCDLK